MSTDQHPVHAGSDLSDAVAEELGLLHEAPLAERASGYRSLTERLRASLDNADIVE
ncbi:MAG TPA: hypothetical protein VFU07_04345 [Candidatus Lumbricidophila sp.]|nr:hypothetical protein [Candidatus Lumbricidophila sp.]